MATADLMWSTKLTADMIKLVSFPEENLPEGYLSTTERLHGRILITSIKANEPILNAKLAPLDVTQGGVAAITQPEKAGYGGARRRCRRRGRLHQPG